MTQTPLWEADGADSGITCGTAVLDPLDSFKLLSKVYHVQRKSLESACLMISFSQADLILFTTYILSDFSMF